MKAEEAKDGKQTASSEEVKVDAQPVDTKAVDEKPKEDDVPVEASTQAEAPKEPEKPKELEEDMKADGRAKVAAGSVHQRVRQYPKRDAHGWWKTAYDTY